MCQEVKVSAGAMLVSSLLTKAGALFVVAGGSAAALYVLAQGSAAVAWIVVGLTAWAALATIGWIVMAASSRRKVVAPSSAPVGRRPAVVEVRPALVSAGQDPAQAAHLGLITGGDSSSR